MKIDTQQVGSADVLFPMGALVDQDGEGFSKLLMERVTSSNPRVVVSLKEVPYLDSVALEGLLDATDELAHRAMTLKLVGVPPACREILELTDVSSKFSFFESVQDAVRSFL